MSTVFKDKKSGKWRAIIRREGHRVVSQTGFDTKEEGKDWARVIETEMLFGIKLPEKVPSRPATTLDDALTTYKTTETVKKKSADREINRITLVKRQKIAQKNLKDITSEDINDYIKERMNSPNKRGKTTSGSTVRLEVMLISAVYKTCSDKSLINPVQKATLPKKTNGRERVLFEHEYEYLKKGFAEAMPKTACMNDLLDIAIETGMREGELLKIQFFDIYFKNRYIHLSHTKSGVPRDVPLSPNAILILDRLNRESTNTEARVFKLSQDALVRAFPKACQAGKKIYEKETGSLPSPRFLNNLKFHDLRHQAATRWSKFLHAQELAKMFGWKTLELVMLYYNPDIPTIADKLAKS